MKTIIYLLSFVIACTFLGCTPVVYNYDLKTGKLEKRYASSSEDAEFMDSVDDAIKLELKNDPLNYGTWRDYWINRCEQIHYWNPPGKDEPLIQYIINKRREAGLPDISEIDKRQFRSQWQNYTDDVDERLAMESKGLPPLSTVDVKQLKKTKTWPEYWRAYEENMLNNPAISTNGVEYIDNRRKQMGLPPLN
jgi:hypothetical protein